MTEIMPELPTSEPGRLRSENVPSLETVIIMSKNPPKSTFSFENVMNAGGSKDFEKLKSLEKLIQTDDLFNIQFTSGTTGSPKGACLSHHNVINNAYGIGHRLGYHREHHRVCVPVPLYHCFGSVAGVINSMNHGCTLIFPSPHFDGLAAMKAIEKEKCTSLYGTPTMFVDMLAHQVKQRFDVSSLKTGIIAGASVPEEVCKQMMTDLNMKGLQVAYGLTETSPVSFQGFSDDDITKRTSTIGFPSDWVEAKVVDENGLIVPVGTQGEICTRGYNTMLGYWDDKMKTAETITPDRWLHTGDIGVFDSDGYGRIVGRIKDMVIRGGENLYPVEIEEALYSHPSIKEVQIVGVPDPRMGEELTAWIRVQEGHNLTADEIKAYFKGKIAHFKIPRYFFFVDSFPTTVTGKIQKFRIREITMEKLGLKKEAN